MQGREERRTSMMQLRRNSGQEGCMPGGKEGRRDEGQDDTGQ